MVVSHHGPRVLRAAVRGADRGLEPHPDAEDTEATGRLGVLADANVGIEGSQPIEDAPLERQAVGGRVGVGDRAGASAGEPVAKKRVVRRPCTGTCRHRRSHGSGHHGVAASMRGQSRCYPAWFGQAVGGEEGHDRSAGGRSAGISGAARQEPLRRFDHLGDLDTVERGSDQRGGTVSSGGDHDHFVGLGSHLGRHGRDRGEDCPLVAVAHHHDGDRRRHHRQDSLRWRTSWRSAQGP